LTDTKMFEAMDMSLRRFTLAGFSLRQAVVALTTLYSYTVGFVIEEQAMDVAPGMPNEQYALEMREQRVNKELYPLAAEAGAEMFTNHDSRFEEGVRLIVAGIASALPAACKVD
jgi:TetR/AcrR family transcriptional regulator, tetracycline repressor protein